MQVTLNALPASLAEFRNLSLKTPDEVVAGFLCALNLYVKNPNEGVEAMNILRGPRPMTPYDSQFLRDRLRGKEYLPLAYFAGATPQKQQMPARLQELRDTGAAVAGVIVHNQYAIFTVAKFPENPQFSLKVGFFCF